MDACLEAFVRVTAGLYCMLMKWGDRSPAESLMFSSRWSYTGTQHLSSSFTFFQFDICAPPIVWKIYAQTSELFSSLFPSFPPLQELHVQGYRHHRRLSGISWSSPCQHHRGAEWLAEFHTLVQASQRRLWACPRNASWPQPQLLALTGSKSRRERERVCKGNTVIKLEETEVSHTAWLPEKLILACQISLLEQCGWNDPSGTRCISVVLHH